MLAAVAVATLIATSCRIAWAAGTNDGYLSRADLFVVAAWAFSMLAVGSLVASIG